MSSPTCTRRISRGRSKAFQRVLEEPGVAETVEDRFRISTAIGVELGIDRRQFARGSRKCRGDGALARRLGSANAT